MLNNVIYVHNWVCRITILYYIIKYKLYIFMFISMVVFSSEVTEKNADYSNSISVKQLLI